MPSKRTNAEEIIDKLGEADVLLGQGQNVSGVCKQLGISEQTYAAGARPMVGRRWARRSVAKRSKLNMHDSGERSQT